MRFWESEADPMGLVFKDSNSAIYTKSMHLFKFLDRWLIEDIDDSSAAALQPSKFKLLCEIKVKFDLVRVISHDNRMPNSRDFVPAVVGSLPEKCLKGRAISTHVT